MANELATKAGTWRGFLDRPDIQAQIAAAIRTDISPKTVARVTLSNMLRNPKLMECSQGSVIQAVLTACALGLEPDGVSGQAYLVPYRDVCTLIPGYRGLIQLAYRSGEVLSIQALNVYSNEKFERHIGAIPPVTHVPKPPEQRGEYVGSYAVATIKGGGCVCEHMWKSEIEAIRDRSASYQSAMKFGKKDSPWFTDTDEMRRKTVVRRLFKYIPSSAALRQAVAIEDEFEADRDTFVDMMETPAPKTKAARLTAQLKDKTPPPEPETPIDNGEQDLDAALESPPSTPSTLIIGSKRAAELKAALLELPGEARADLYTQFGLRAVSLDAGLLKMTETTADALQAEIGCIEKGI